MNNPIIIHHNFDAKKFKWLYAKYAYGVNPNHHCTNAIKGKYSKRFTRHNPDFLPGNSVIMDEFPSQSWDAIYICGVSAKGYSRHENYSHNVHVAILPSPGHKDTWRFEDWEMTVENGVFEYVISEEELEEKYKNLPDEYVKCRMFRWAVSHYKQSLKEEEHVADSIVIRMQLIMYGYAGLELKRTEKGTTASWCAIADGGMFVDQGSKHYNKNFDIIAEKAGKLRILNSEDTSNCVEWAWEMYNKFGELLTGQEYGFWPLINLEQLVDLVEDFLNDEEATHWLRDIMGA